MRISDWSSDVCSSDLHQLTWSRVSFTTAARRSTQAKRVNTNVRSETHRNRQQGRGEGCETPPASCGPGSGRRLRWRQRAAERPARAGKDLGRQPEGMVIYLDHRPGRRRQGGEGAAAGTATTVVQEDDRAE